MRLSLCIDLAIPVVERLVLLQEDLEEPFHHLGIDAEWTAAERLRYAMRVIPDADPSVELRLREVLRTMVSAIAPYRVETFGAQFAPSEEQAQYVVAGHRGGADALASHGRQVEAALETLGVAREVRPAIPVVSLARLKTEREAPVVSGVLRPYSETSFGESEVREWVLYRSEVSRGKEQVRQVERFVLKGTR